jgi:hypothetical protein
MTNIPGIPGIKPKPAPRDLLPARRHAETVAFEFNGSRYRVTFGSYADGRIGEVFLAHDRADSFADALASDAAILASLALQYGCPLEAIAHALRRDARGISSSPIGRALELIR